MTFEEFKGTLGWYGFEVEKSADNDYYVFYNGSSVAHFYSDNLKVVLTNDFDSLSNAKKARVLKALARYIEESHEKKYKYKVPEFLWEDYRDCLFIYKNNDSFCIGYDEYFDDYDFQSHFTDAEMEELIKEHGDDFKKFIEICKKVEVE